MAVLPEMCCCPYENSAFVEFAMPWNSPFLTEMAEMAKLHPEYGFERNMGYGTAEHIHALRTYGPTPFHRRSFIGNFVREADA